MNDFVHKSREAHEQNIAGWIRLAFGDIKIVHGKSELNRVPIVKSPRTEREPAGKPRKKKNDAEGERKLSVLFITSRVRR